MNSGRSLIFAKPDGSLMPIDRVKASLANVFNPKDLSDFARKAEAAKRACEQTDERRDYFAELSLWAFERLGTLLAAMPKNKGAQGNPMGRGAKIVRLQTATAQLKDIGIEKTIAHRSQKIAAAGPKVLESYIAGCRSQRKEITKSGALVAAKRHLREQSLNAAAAQQLPAGFTITRRQDVIPCDLWIPPPKGICTTSPR